METVEFQNGAERLLTIAREKPVAYMCAEGLFWQCHRRLVSDYFLMCGEQVLNILPSGEARTHSLTKGALIHAGRLTYPGSESEEPRLLF